MVTSEGRALEHLFWGKLMRMDVPAGDFRVMSWSRGLTRQSAQAIFARASFGSFNLIGSVEGLTRGYGLLKLNASELLFVRARRSELRDRGYDYPEFHVVVLPETDWRQTNGNLPGLIESIEACQPWRSFSVAGSDLAPLAWIAPPPRAEEDDSRSIAERFGQIRELIALVSALLDGESIAVRGAPGPEARLAWLQAFLSLLPAPARAEVTFATEVFDGAGCSAQLKFLHADPYARPAHTDVVYEWDGSISTDIENWRAYSLYLREYESGGPIWLSRAVAALARDYPALAAATRSPAATLDQLALTQRPLVLQYGGDWLVETALKGTSAQLLELLADRKAQLQWPEPMRIVAQRISDQSGPASASGLLARAIEAVAPRKQRFALPLVEVSVARKKFDLLDKSAFDRLAALAQDAAARDRLIRLVDSVSAIQWVNALNLQAVWGLLNLTLLLLHFRGGAKIYKALYRRQKSGPEWQIAAYDFWAKHAQVYLPEHLLALTEELERAKLPARELLGALVPCLEALEWQAPELVARLLKLYPTGNLPADEPELLTRLVIGLSTLDSLAAQELVARALGRLFKAHDAAVRHTRVRTFAELLAQGGDRSRAQAVYALLMNEPALSQDWKSIKSVFSEHRLLESGHFFRRWLHH